MSLSIRAWKILLVQRIKGTLRYINLKTRFSLGDTALAMFHVNILSLWKKAETIPIEMDNLFFYDL